MFDVMVQTLEIFQNPMVLNYWCISDMMEVPTIKDFKLALKKKCFFSLRLGELRE